MRKLVPVLSLVLSLAVTSAYAHYPGKITIAAAAKKMAGVPFDHAKHGDTLVKNCGTCHHTQKDLTKAHTNTTDVKKCSTCHLDPKGSMPGMREASMTKNPFHIACISCHKENKKGPTVCKDCHRKG